ncbi:MAG: 1,3-beta-galactosyl-N-acetylhexosamine phosphorylase [Oscillospiraceae bacterium]|nr:1,3-beta-galactosyl-N-acetylhexosamine phosphorylase [Oscillospiraceae bacterium]
MNRGNFTLPGESGYENLTLEMAKRWGADVIRDSDGTKLSSEILNSGHKIYSTICPVREHNEWIRENKLTRQQTFLCTTPMVAIEKSLNVDLMNDFFDEQFEVNDTSDGMRYWQVYNRTTEQELPRDMWTYSAETGVVTIETTPMQQYTVSFLAWRIWEEISMYNHVTNDWGDKEHLMQLNPYRPEALDYLKKWLVHWCEENPDTDVVRFTSLFYNFTWMWGSNDRRRNVFTDWASYNFTVCTEALDDFVNEYGYALCAEDFVRGGRYYATHRVPNKRKSDWMEFIGKFVRQAGRELVDIVHAAGKLAYVFYDDNWVGLEPYSGHFSEFGFDGLVKCVFSGFEARLCAGVPVDTHEIRFHPYLFPVGLGGAPTFSEGGRPGDDALKYWINVRRALLRERIERCGLGGYLSLAIKYPDFLKAMDNILDEFRQVLQFHDGGVPHSQRAKVAILHAWGKLRTWTLSGHFHETDKNILIHVLESLSGLPFDVEFLSFDDIKSGVPNSIDVIINAGNAGDAWSGGEYWADVEMIDNLTKWVNDGGVFVGVGEPSALQSGHSFLRMSHVLGVDIDIGDYTCHGRWVFDVEELPGLIPDGMEVLGRSGVMLTDGKARVLATANGEPAITEYSFGKGRGIYCADFEHGIYTQRFLQNIILQMTEGNMTPEGISNDIYVECAVYPHVNKIALINNSSQNRSTKVAYDGKIYEAELKPFELRVTDIVTDS